MPPGIQVAIITGASSGIGAELARQLAASGVRVGLTARRVEALERLAGAIRAQGGTAAVEAADATDRAATRSAFSRLLEELGPVDLLIANAGVGAGTPASAFSAEAVERIIRVNVLGAVDAIEAVLPVMLERRRGHVVGVSSLAAYRGMPGSSAYGASKAALSALLEGLRVELHSHGIAVTTVQPGYIRTPMTEGAAHSQPFLMDVEPAARIILKGIAARRREINFPWQTAMLMSLVRRLPNAVYDALARRLLVPR